MKKIIYSKYDKRLIPTLPRLVFPGRIFVVLTRREAEQAVNYLLKQSILGVDTETRPSFHRGTYYKVSLLQVATHDKCFLFRLNHTGLTRDIIRLLEDTTVPKVGLSWHDDLGQLHKQKDFKPGLFIELQHEVRRIGIEDMSLQKLYANLFGMRISKSEQLSNWERDVLDEKQKQYAATDAWSCINLYEEILRLEATGDYELHVAEELEHESGKSQANSDKTNDEQQK